MAKKKKSLYDKLTINSFSSQKDADGIKIRHQRFGVENKINNVHPALILWGDVYQRIFRTCVRRLQDGKNKSQLIKDIQQEFKIDWHWADTLQSDAQGTIDQLQASKDNQIEELESDINKGYEKVDYMISDVESRFENPTIKTRWGIPKILKGIKSKLERLAIKKIKLDKLKIEERLPVCFGTKKLFNAQHNLKANGYNSHAQWLKDWKDARSGNFQCKGDGNKVGGNRGLKIHHIEGDKFQCEFVVPKFMKEEFGDKILFDFTLRGQQTRDLIYAINNKKPITSQIFRRENKDSWYIHITSYAQFVPWQHKIENGCLGIDFNAESLDVIYVKNDGNPFSLKGVETEVSLPSSRHENIQKIQGKFVMFSFPLNPYWTSGQRKAALRDIAADIVYLAQLFNCGIAAEGLDFGVKKSQMRHSGSKKYNRMLSGLVYDGFRVALMSAADKVGVQVKFVFPQYTSTIGIAKYMAVFGLSSGMAAGIVIARKAMGFTEKVTKKYYTGFLKTDSDLVKPQRITWKHIHFLTRECKITRHSRFNIATYIKALIERFHEKSKRRRKPALNSNPIRELESYSTWVSPKPT